LARLLGHLPSKCTLTFAHSFAELSRNCAKPHIFGSLAAAFGDCFLRLQKAKFGSTSGRCKEMLQDHGIWLSFGSLAATYGAVPFSCWTPGGRKW